MKKHLDHFLFSLIDFIFRRPLPGIKLIGYGVGLLALLFAGFAISVGIPTKDGRFEFSFDSGAGVSTIVFAIIMTLAVALIVLGGLWIVVDLRKERRQKVIAIELRGLRDTSGQPLDRAIPWTIKGQRDPLLLDIRQGADGTVLSPEHALIRLQTLPHSIDQRVGGRDRGDISLVAAGMASVPMSFLMGVLLDDEDQVTIMDWDRSQENWRSLDAVDDGERFVVTGLEALGDAAEAVLVVSVSYPEDRLAIAHSFAGLPVVRLGLEKPSTDSHWSAVKQAAWAQQFFDVARHLCGTKVRAVHLVLVAPNSVVIALGRRYDKRNLPAISVYQYENGSPAAYPWGVAMPVAGTQIAVVVHRP